MNFCLVVPHYNHSDSFERFLPALKSLAIPCVVVDDGSEKTQVEKVKTLLEGEENFFFTCLPYNRGKGAAVLAGAFYARHLGFTHVLQIDADGQHDINDVEKLIEASRNNEKAIISGKPYFDDDAPKARVYGRRVTDFWVGLETLSYQIKDGLCGFRVYPIAALEKIIDHHFLGVRMDFDTEVLVKAVWEDIPLQFIPTKVIYPETGVSHFHYLRDNLALIRLHTRLLLGMVIQSPKLIYRRIRAFL